MCKSQTETFTALPDLTHISAMSEMFQALHPSKSCIYFTYKANRCADLLNAYYIFSCHDATVIGTCQNIYIYISGQFWSGSVVDALCCVTLCVCTFRGWVEQLFAFFHVLVQNSVTGLLDHRLITALGRMNCWFGETFWSITAFSSKTIKSYWRKRSTVKT